MTKRWVHYLEKISNGFEIVIAFLLLIVVAVKVVELVAGLAGQQIVVLPLEFSAILSTALALVIGVEFVKMLYKHTPETVIDVLLFAIARQMVVYHEKMPDMLVGVVAIAGLFAAKRFLIDRQSSKDREG